jgi:hypothetical protein
MISKDGEGVLITPLLKFEGLPSNEKVDSFSKFLTSFLSFFQLLSKSY